MPRIIQLPSLTTADNADEIAIVDVSASTTKKITRGDLLKSPLPTNSVTTAAVADNAITASKLDFATLNFRPIASGVATLPAVGENNESLATVTIPTQADTSYMVQLTGQHGGNGTGHAPNTILYRNKDTNSFQIYSYRTVATTPQEVSYIVYRSM